MNCSLLPAPRSLFNRAPHVARVHVGEPDLDPVPLGVASQDVERIEPHRLVVEEGAIILGGVIVPEPRRLVRSEEHTSEPSHQIISYAVFCLKKKKERNPTPNIRKGISRRSMVKRKTEL